MSVRPGVNVDALWLGEIALATSIPVWQRPKFSV